MSGVSKLMRRKKVSVTQTPVSPPNIIKLYSNGMGRVDIMDQKQLFTESIVKGSIVS